jgi:hypothetical protein
VATAVGAAVISGLVHIGIDEISRKLGHVYVTNVYDLRRTRLLWCGENRTRLRPQTPTEAGSAAHRRQSSER